MGCTSSVVRYTTARRVIGLTSLGFSETSRINVAISCVARLHLVLIFVELQFHVKTFSTWHSFSFPFALGRRRTQVWYQCPDLNGIIVPAGRVHISYGGLLDLRPVPWPYITILFFTCACARDATCRLSLVSATRCASASARDSNREQYTA